MPNRPRTHNPLAHTALILAALTIVFVPAMSNSATSAATPAAGSHAHAYSAHTISISERANLRLVAHHSGVLYEQGPTSGTPGGTLAVRIRISYAKASISFAAYPSGGSVVGSGQASVYAEGSHAHFAGVVSVTHGTGRFANATGTLHIEGASNRSTYAISLNVVGQLKV